MRAIDADALQLAIVEEGQANKRKKYIIGDIWELTGAEIREVINSQPTIQPEIIRCKDCKHNPNLSWFGCPMSHLSEAQRPETAWCWKAERRAVTE